MASHSHKPLHSLSRGKTIDTGRAEEIAKEQGLDSEGKEIKEIVLDGNLEVVTDQKTAEALVEAEKQKAEAKPAEKPAPKKEEKPKAEKPVKPAEKKVIEAPMILTGYNTQELLAKIKAFKELVEVTPDLLLSIDGQWNLAKHTGGDMWHLIYKHTDITTTGPMGRVKIQVAKPGEINAWQKKLGNKK